jgi:hypothetical protein
MSNKTLKLLTITATKMTTVGTITRMKIGVLITMTIIADTVVKSMLIHTRYDSGNLLSNVSMSLENLNYIK